MRPDRPTFFAATLTLFLLAGMAAAADHGASPVNGTWYLALDAEPFGLPPGTNLPGTMIIDQNGSVEIIDGGDFGGAPFPTRDTAQHGAWRWRHRTIEAVTLFLQADAISGDVLAWQRVEFSLTPDGTDRMTGTVNVFALPCDLPAPFPVFGCPNPIAAAGSFVALPPFDIPILLERLKPIRLSSP